MEDSSQNSTPEVKLPKTFASHDVYARSWVPTFREEKFTVGGRQIDFPNKLCTRLDYTPEGRENYDPAKVIESLYGWSEGLADLVDAFDHQTVELPPLLLMSTKLKQAMAAQKMGFKLIDQCLDSTGAVNKNLATYTVVANIEDVRKAVYEFRQSSAGRELKRRVAA